MESSRSLISPGSLNSPEKSGNLLMLSVSESSSLLLGDSLSVEDVERDSSWVVGGGLSWVVGGGLTKATLLVGGTGVLVPGLMTLVARSSSFFFLLKLLNKPGGGGWLTDCNSRFFLFRREAACSCWTLLAKSSAPSIA